MCKVVFTIKTDDVTLQLQEQYNFNWLKKLGRVFTVFDQQDSGNICFGVEKGGTKYFVKFAGAKPLDFQGNPQDAVVRLIQAIPLYNALSHPALIHMTSHFQVETVMQPFLNGLRVSVCTRTGLLPEQPNIITRTHLFFDISICRLKNV